MFATKAEHVEVGDFEEAQASILTADACAFLTKLARAFERRRQDLLDARGKRQSEIENGKMPDFLPETAHIRESQWKVAPLPPALLDRRVELTGPTDRKTIVSAMNSGANVFVADLEESATRTSVIEGQINLRAAVRRTISFTGTEGKHHKLCDSPALLMVRPRGWHVDEKNFCVDGKPISAALFDFGLFWFHNACTQVHNFDRPCFYLPKLESPVEARLWNDVYVMAQRELGLRHGTIRATVVIENIFAAFEMDEILWELRYHSAGLNCGGWEHANLLVQTCHRRGVHAIGGMAPAIPIQNGSDPGDAALKRERQDKLRQVWAGHDGTSVAHPALVPLAREVFDTYMRTPNQIDRKRVVDAADGGLFTLPPGQITGEQKGLDNGHR